MIGEEVTPPVRWRVGEFWSASTPGRKVFIVCTGKEIWLNEDHKDFIRWVGDSDELLTLSSGLERATETIALLNVRNVELEAKAAKGQGS